MGNRLFSRISLSWLLAIEKTWSNPRPVNAPNCRLGKGLCVISWFVSAKARQDVKHWIGRISLLLPENFHVLLWSMPQCRAYISILCFVQYCGSMTFWCGSGSGSTDPCLWHVDPDQQHYFGTRFKLIRNQMGQRIRIQAHPNCPPEEREIKKFHVISSLLIWRHLLKPEYPF